MTKDKIPNITQTNVARLIHNGPAVVYAIIISASAATNTIIYDGTNSLGEEKYRAYVAANGNVNFVTGMDGVRFNNGIFINPSAATNYVSVVYSPLNENNKNDIRD